MAAFEDVSSPDASQKEKILQEGDAQPHAVEQTGSELQQRMAAIEEVSSPDVFQKEKLLH